MASCVRLPALLMCLLFVVFASAITDHTHINNLSSKNICATTSYWTNFPPLASTGNSQFVNREINAGGSDVDEYLKILGEIHVEVWVLADGQSCESATGKHSTAVIGTDDSVTVQDNSDGQGVDVYNAGTKNQLQSLGITVYSAPSFAARPTNQGLPDQTRIATLQDVSNPHLDLSKIGLSSDSIAELVDGWIKGSDGNYATGTDDDQGFNTHLGIIDLTLPAGTTDGSYDAVPLAADPGGNLAKRTDSELDQIVPPLQKRAGFSNANNAQIQTMKDLIAMWDLPGLPKTGKQQTLYSLNGFRIDQQLNGPVQRGDNGDFYWQVAVQAGSNLYAAVMIPAGDNVSAGGIRKALYQSLQDGALYGFARSAKKTWRWTIVLGALLILVL